MIDLIDLFAELVSYKWMLDRMLDKELPKSYKKESVA